MDPNQQQLLLTTGGKKSTYIDDVFSTYLYDGVSSTQTITNGIDLGGEGGMVWAKSRSDAHNSAVYDTERGIKKSLCTNTSGAEIDLTSSSYFGVDQFNNNGFRTGWENTINAAGKTYASWSFRKAPGFFDVVTYTGNSTNRTIAHSLGCVPGLIMIKQTNSTSSWSVYHRSTGAGNRLYLNSTDAVFSSSAWNNVMPTSTNFTVSGAIGDVNSNGNEYVAYVFAGGESTAATARSVDFDGSDYLSLAPHSALELGTGDFTIECWFNVTSSNTQQSFINDWDNSNYQVEINTDRKCQFSWGGYSTSAYAIIGMQKVAAGTWNHLAIVRNGNVFTQYLNGIFDGTFTSAGGSQTNGITRIGRNSPNNRYVVGKISNLRIVKGTAVYTSAFRPITEPLANITNTELLCCNNPSVTSGLRIPGSISSNGDPQPSTDSPFDDPEGFVFGEEGDQSIIKTGSYVGNGSATGPEINIGWQPQFVIIKQTSAAGQNWRTLDSMRGIVSGGNDAQLYPSSTGAENTSEDRLELTATGFNLTSSNADTNGTGENYIYIAIRFPDGYVAKPALAGTEVFGLTTGQGSTSRPSFVTNFPVDFNTFRKPATSGQNWQTSARLIGSKVLWTNDTNAESAHGDYVWDSTVGVTKDFDSSYQAWSWKRGAGFDVVTYAGNAESPRAIPHNLGRTPKMIWCKSRSHAEDWAVYHIGMNGGVNPENYYMLLNMEYAENNNTSRWNAPPTSSVFHVGNDGNVNDNNKTYVAMLFANVDGISKCGYYTGTGAAGNTQTTGFTPRFILVKCVTDTVDWGLFDTLRGLGSSGNDERLYLNTTAAQVGGYDYLTTSATGFTPAFVGSSVVNSSGQKYIYYAHA